MTKTSLIAFLTISCCMLFACGGGKNSDALNDAEVAAETEVINEIAPETLSTDFPKIELTDDNAGKYVDFLEKVKTRSPEWEQKFNESAVSAMAALLTSNATFENLIKEAGFKDRNEFYVVTVRIQQVFVSLQNSESHSEIKGGSQKAMEEFDRQLQNPALDENTKNLLRTQREQIKKSLEEYEKSAEKLSADVTESELEVLKKYLPKINGKN